jgi:hypothetical protein
MNRTTRVGAAVFLVLFMNRIQSGDKGVLNGFLGTWRGTSTCVNREAAPACTDETVIYEVRRADAPDAAVLKADKIVDGQRVSMGELAFHYSQKDACWRSEISTPRVHAVWCLTIEGRVMTGSLRQLPGNTEVRKVQLKHE